MNISAINRVMPRGRGDFKLVKKDYTTNDIIKLIINVHPKCLADTKELVKTIPGNTIETFTRNLYNLVKQNIRYKLDPPDAQYVKSPAQVWADKFADCKSYSLFIATALENKGIPYKYRFTSYRKRSKIPTHVYVIVPFGSNYITMDAVMPGYNQEKPFTFKKDIEMKQGLHFVSGIGSTAPIKQDISFSLEGKDITQLTDGELDLLIAKDQLKTRQAIVNGLRGIGTQQAEEYQDKIDVIDDALEAIDRYKHGNLSGLGLMEEIEMIAEDAISGVYSLAPELAGLGDIGKASKRKEKKAARKTARKEKKAAKKEARKEKKQIKKTLKGSAKKEALKKVKDTKKEKVKEAKKVIDANRTKTGKFLKKAAKTAAKGVKAVTKVATLPQRTVIKDVLELQLPKAAPFFLYLFINDPATIKKLPSKVRSKRKKAELIANFIVNVIGMKRSHFMGIVRNGIMKKFGQTPENIIAAQMKGKLKGIGIAPIIGAAVSVVVKLIGALVKAFKKKKGETPSVSTNDAPDESDWDEISDPEAFKSEQVSNASNNLKNISKKSGGKKNERLEKKIQKLEQKAKTNPKKARALERVNDKLEKLSKSSAVNDQTKVEKLLDTFSDFIDNAPEDQTPVDVKKLEREIKTQPENTSEPLDDYEGNQFDSGGRSIWNSLNS